ncbi:Uncharacterized protein PODLI_1B019812, partial [Podarcis lilfordi]
RYPRNSTSLPAQHFSDELPESNSAFIFRGCPFGSSSATSITRAGLGGSGVMLAASYWSLLAPAIELAEDSGKFGAFAFFPVAVGFTLGAAFVYFADLILPWLDFAAAATVSLVTPISSRPACSRMQAVQLSQKPEQQEGLLLSLCVLWSGASYRAKNTQIPAPNPNILCALSLLKSLDTVIASATCRRKIPLDLSLKGLPHEAAVLGGFFGQAAVSCCCPLLMMSLKFPGFQRKQLLSLPPCWPGRREAPAVLIGCVAHPIRSLRMTGDGACMPCADQIGRVAWGFAFAQRFPAE